MEPIYIPRMCTQDRNLQQLLMITSRVRSFILQAHTWSCATHTDTGKSGERIWNKWSWMDWECIQEDIPDSEQTMHGHILTWHLSPQMQGWVGVAGGGGCAGKLSWWITPCLHFLLLLLFVKWSSACLHWFCSYGSGVSPQCPVSWACELIVLMGSHTVPGQHRQPTWTLLGQGCVHVYM